MSFFKAGSLRFPVPCRTRYFRSLSTSRPHFPCVDAHAARESQIRRKNYIVPSQSTVSSESGPEPPYARPNPTSYNVYHHDTPMPLAYGSSLRPFDIAYETWGTLSPSKDNVILLHTGLSASSHAASTPLNPAPGWWEKFIGPGKALDTNQFFIICTNALGGCYGSTGPSSIDASTGHHYATTFPILSIFDMVRAQFYLLDHLGINKLYASVGCSMGAMQSLAAGWLHPEAMSSVQKDADGFITGVADEETAVAKGDNSELIDSTFEVTVTLADQQGNPDSPLHSVKTFEELGLHEDLLKGLFQMRFSKPSKIQERALPLLLSNPPVNMIGQSQSGTGKTAAFVLTMLSRIDFTQNKTQALCLAPSRELARQIMSVVLLMGKHTPVQTEYAIKDHLPKGATRITAHIVVGTAGTMIDLVRRKVIDASGVKVFVLDEADNMLDQDGLGDQTLRVKNMLPKQGVQIILFSATFPDHVRKFADKFAPNSNKIELKKEELNVDNIKQFYMDCRDAEHKYDILVSLYSLLTVGQSIIFCQHRHTADRISQRMTAEGHKVASLHGAKDAAERDAIIDGFRAGRDKVLITTNVIARGIDIMQVNMVVNYDLPLMGERGTQKTQGDMTPDLETYIHRIGRTGRFGRKGVSINFVHNKDTWNQMEAIEKGLGKKITRIETNDLDSMEANMKKAMK